MKIVFSKTAVKVIEKMDKRYKQRIRDAIEEIPASDIKESPQINASMENGKCALKIAEFPGCHRPSDMI